MRPEHAPVLFTVRTPVIVMLLLGRWQQSITLHGSIRGSDGVERAVSMEG
jgi:hypothetical protein